VLKRLTLQEKLYSVSKDFIPVCAISRSVRFVRGFVNVPLKFKGYIGLGLFNDKQGPYLNKEVSSKLVRSTPHIDTSMFGVFEINSVDVEVAPKLGVQGFNSGSVCHTDSYAYVEAGVIAPDFLEDVDVAFTIKKASDVVKIHSNTSVSSRMLANSEKTPSHGDVEGQPRAKQEAGLLLGVCNEHVPTPEGKICSELYRNVEKAAEMIASAFMYLRVKGMPRLVTDCNTKYIFWRPHARRNMVPLDPDRFSVNQDAMVRLIGWAGNMTLSNGFLQGILTA
jgi:hypothetical protein